MIPLEDFLKAYKDCRKTKRRKESQVLFEVDYERNLIDLCNEVNDRTYKIGPSICFCVTRPKLREVFAADFRDRVIHHVIMQRLEPIFERVFIEDNYNCRKDKGTLYGIHRLNNKLNTFSENYTKDCWIGKFDLRGFFMSIRKELLWEKLKNLIDKEYQNPVDKDDLLWLVEKVVKHNPTSNCIIHGDRSLFNQLPPEKSLFKVGESFGMAIGNLTSQMFANYFMNDFDLMMSARFQGNYGRYVDDFYILTRTKEEITSFIPYLRQYLKDTLGVTLNEKKIYIQPSWHGVSFLGNTIKKGRIYTNNRTISNIINMILEYNNKKDTKENAKTFLNRFNSYLGFLKHTKSYAIRRELFQLIDSKWWNYFRIYGDYRKILSKS